MGKQEQKQEKQQKEQEEGDGQRGRGGAARRRCVLLRLALALWRGQLYRLADAAAEQSEGTRKRKRCHGTRARACCSEDVSPRSSPYPG